MARPNVLVLKEAGINCEKETAFAFNQAGANARITHLNNIIASPGLLDEAQILAVPGGFSYGDDTGAGRAMANKMKNHLGDEIRRFAESDKLVIGICNGFQVLTELGLLPGLEGNYEKRRVALVHNDNSRYTTRWVDVQFEGNNNHWTKGFGKMSLPIAHGEGKFYTDDATLNELKSQGLIAAKYVRGHICDNYDLEANPNGSLEDIAGITDPSGRIFGMMPHPERAIHFTQLPGWTSVKETLKRDGKDIPDEGPGIQIFNNGVGYFK